MTLLEFCKENSVPNILEEWDYTKNIGLTPEKAMPSSSKRVWWKCGKGHEWQSTIENRTVKGYGCPYCAGSKAWPGFNDLGTLYPKLMKQWHPTLNVGLEPSKLRPGSQKRAYWICSEGHVWDTVIYQRTGRSPSNCPYCSGRLKGSAKAEKIDLVEARRQAEAKEEHKRDLRRQRTKAARSAQS